MSPRALSLLCNVIAAAALLVAAGFVIFGSDKGIGIFMLLFAAVLARVLILNIAEPLHQRHEAAQRSRVDGSQTDR